uniref:Elongation of very long chain fatty acids protein n=1 Tax=Platynereis dumerilii TaxID=6359 RepID=A0AA96LZ51_PLADU|nr:elongation of very long chain fatty acids protein elovl-like [Platynereis dumerilii]
MANSIVSMSKKWEEVLAQKDPRVDDYPLMDSPTPSFVLCGLYVLFVTKIGPAFMENRKPFEIRNIMAIYNFVMVVLSGYLCYEFAAAGWFAGYSLGCQPVDYSTSPQAVRMVRICWLFYFSKFVEFFDTIFFVLRKKYNQVSFLHVFHHGIMPISWWFGVKFVPGGFGTFHALLNSFIHFVMYIYYGMAGLGPQYQKYLWWKKYMTSMQMIQFLMVLVHSFQLFIIDCNYPRLFAYWIGAYAVIFLTLFADFYINAYQKKPIRKEKGVLNNNGLMENGTSHKKDA